VATQQTISLEQLGRQRSRGMQHDFFTGDWTYTCKVCDEMFDSKSKTVLSLMYKYHTKNECLGGW